MPKQVRLRGINITLRLIGREDDVTHPRLDQQRQPLIVRSRLRQPERLRFTTKTKTEIRQPPDNLRQTIAFVAERQNRVPVSLRDRVAVTGARLSARFIRVQDLLISRKVMRLQ